jgi:RNA polymerase sigma-70 factor (ECF subfamily)
MAEPDDNALMDAIASGEATGLRALYDRHAGLVFALCLRMLRDRAEAEELLSEIFWEVWNRAARYDATRASPVTYLMTLTRSRAIDRQRSRQSKLKLKTTALDSDHTARLTQPASVGRDNPLGQTIAGEQSKIVRSALSALEPAQREAIECAYYDGLSHSEIAAKLNKPLGTVKTYIRQGLIRLRDTMSATA